MSQKLKSEAVGQIQTRLKNLRHVLTHRGERAKKRYRTYVGVGVVLIVVSVTSLVTLTHAALKLDASALTQIGRLEVEKHLPAGRASLAGYLRREAPSMVKRTLRTLLDSLPKLRTLLVRELDTKLGQITDEGRRRLGIEMETAIQASKESLEQEFPDLSDIERMEKLVAIVASDFAKNVEIALDAIYPEYVAEINRIEAFVVDLHTKDGAELTERERTQKELIRTLLELMVIENSKQKKRA